MFSGERLREARKGMIEHGRRVSQERFALLLGVSRRTPQRWEMGATEPTASNLARIAELTGKPLGFFYDDRPFRAGQQGGPGGLPHGASARGATGARGSKAGR